MARAGVPMLDGPTRVWQVGALCRAMADALDARFNPVAVVGEITGFSRAFSGHCYFSIKDSSGQLRCVMFKRASALLDFDPRDGALVELSGRLSVYEPRGDLQLIAESMRQAGAGALFEQFLQIKARLQDAGLFDPARKRPLPAMPRGIGIVTSLGAAALYDVATALQRRVPHIPVLLVPAAVQGATAPAELVAALQKLAEFAAAVGTSTTIVDVILLVRGGGSLEDLWAFNDERLARQIAASPIPVVCGVGHETDVTIADMVADLRAPTPTAAAEMVAQPRQSGLDLQNAMQARFDDALLRALDKQSQRLDRTAARLGRPSARVAAQRQLLLAHERRLRLALAQAARMRRAQLRTQSLGLTRLPGEVLAQARERLMRAQLKLELLDPALVLRRGYAWLQDASGKTITSPTQTWVGQPLRATLAHGSLDLTVRTAGEGCSA